MCCCALTCDVVQLCVLCGGARYCVVMYVVVLLFVICVIVCCCMVMLAVVCRSMSACYTTS